MSGSLGVEVLTLQVDDKQYNAGIDNAEKKATVLRGSFTETAKAALGIGKDGKVSLDTLGNAFKNPTAGAKALSLEAGTTLVSSFGAAAVGAAALVGAVVAVGAAMVKSAFDAASVGAALDDASEITGISVERLSGYKFAMEVTGGTIEGFTEKVFKMQQRMEENPEEFEAGLRRIGLTARDLEGLTLDEKLLKVNEAFRTVKPGADQGAAALALFGKQGRDMIPFLNEDIKGLVDRSRELGMTWSTEDAGAAEDLERATAELHQIWSNLWTGLGNFFIPTLLRVVTAGSDVVASLRGMYESVRLLWGEVRNVPEEIKQPKMWTDLAERGVKPVALSLEEAAKVAKEMDKELETTHKNAQKRSDETKKRIDEESRIREKAIADELRQRTELNTHLNKLSDDRAAAEMKRLADEFLNREKADADLAEADRQALDGMYQERYRLEQEDAAKTKAAHEEKIRVFQETWESIKVTTATAFADMLTGATGFKDGFVNIWHSIKDGVANILSEMLGNFIDGFLKDTVGAITGSKGSFHGAFSDALGSPFEGVLGGLTSKLKGWLSTASSWISGLFSGGSSAAAGSAAASAVGAGAAGAGTAAGGAAAGGGVGAAVTGLLTNPVTAIVAGGIGAFVGIKKWMGKREHMAVNDLRDAWFADHGNIEGVNQAAEAAGDTSLESTKAIFTAKKKADFTRAVSNWERLTGRGVPKFGVGGIVMRPTLGIIGERGPEAVIPLNSRGMGETIANLIVDGRTLARIVVPHLPGEVDFLVGRA